MPFIPLISGPEKIPCDEYYNAALKLAHDKKIIKIVYAANWGDLYTDGKLTNSAQRFSEDLINLKRLGKRIFIITNPPMNEEFSPDYLAKSARTNNLFNIYDSSIARNKIERSIYQFVEFGKLTGASIVNPFDYFCDTGFCPIVREGTPLYIDKSHMGAKYTASDAIFIDEILNTN
jgi:hypothetical protein